jgi:hypothetical protein
MRQALDVTHDLRRDGDERSDPGSSGAWIASFTFRGARDRRALGPADGDGGSGCASTSELILLCVSATSHCAAIDVHLRADRAAHRVAIVGVVNVPIIHYSSYGEHAASGAVVTKIRHVDLTLDAGAVVAMIGLCFAVAMLLVRVRGEVQRERNAEWIKAAWASVSF